MLPARSEREKAFFPRNDRPYGLKPEAFQTDCAPGLAGNFVEYSLRVVCILSILL